MTEIYFPQYQLIEREHVREDIVVHPEEELDPLSLAELKNLRKGITTYKAFHPDTLEARQAIALKLGYFQLVAFAEGWKFNSQKYQVYFLPEGHPMLEQVEGEEMVRSYVFDENHKEEVEEQLFGDGLVGKLSDENGLGFRVYEEDAIRMDDDETDDLIRRVREFDPF